VPRKIWGYAMILEFDEELWRIDYSFLWCSWFGWGLISRIYGWYVVGFTQWGFPHTWHDYCLEDLGFMTEKACLAMKRSRNSTCFIIVLCVKRPLVVMSRHRLAMSRPKQKRHKIMPLSNDKSGPVCNNIENRAHAVPIDSFLHCSKSKIALGREPIWDMRKNARQNLSLSSS
jgi:hypothetical protein